MECTQNTQRTARDSCVRTIMEYTHDEYCDILLALGTCNTCSRAGAAAQEFALPYSGRRHPDANVFRQLEQRLLETPTAHVNADRPRAVWTQPMKMP
jgi:hypothetical protein